MQVQYQNSPADVAELLKLVPWHRRMQMQYGGLLVLAGCSLPGSLLLAVLGYFPTLVIGWGLIGLFAVYVVVVAFRSSKTLPDGQLLRPTTLTLEPEGLRSKSEIGWSWRDWSLIRSIGETPSSIAIEISPSTFFLIPRAAFSSADDADRFSQRARAYRSQAGASKPREGSLQVEPPGEAAQRLCYRNTVDDLVTFQFDGLKPNADNTTTVVPAWFWLPLALAAGALVVLFRDSHESIGLMFGAFSFVTTLVATLHTVQPFQKARARRQMDQHLLGERTVTVSPDGVLSQESHSMSFNSWMIIDPVEEDEQFVVLYCRKPVVLHLIPKRAFGSFAESRRFVELARNFRAAAIENQPATAEPAPPDPNWVETGNPYQPPRTQ